MGPVLRNLDPYLGTRTRLCTQKLAQYRCLIGMIVQQCNQGGEYQKRFRQSVSA
jgi:hypothetical protein